jgi:hypothetical protein
MRCAVICIPECASRVLSAMPRLPCFVLVARRAILPAFGRFTGLVPVRPAAGERIVAIARGRAVRAAARGWTPCRFSATNPGPVRRLQLAKPSCGQSSGSPVHASVIVLSKAFSTLFLRRFYGPFLWTKKGVQ